MNQDVNEQTLKDQGQILGAVVSVKEVLTYMAQDRYFTLTEASEYLSMSTRTIRDRLDEIPHRRVGTRILLFKKSELDALLEQFREGGKDELDELVNETLVSVLGDK